MENKIELEKMKFTVITYITEELWEEMIALNEGVLHFIVDEYSEEIVAKLNCSILTKGQGKYEFQWYSSWWQELRNKIFPGWFLNKWPSKKEIKKTVKCVALYPSIKIGDTDHAAYIHFI
jgi:hypothetical protein